MKLRLKQWNFTHLLPYGIMGDQQGLIDGNQYALKWCHKFFTKHKFKTLSANLFNLCIYLFLLQGTSVLGPIIPIGAHILSAVFIMKNSEVNLFENHPVLFLLTWGMISSKITCKLVVCILFVLFTYFHCNMIIYIFI